MLGRLISETEIQVDDGTTYKIAPLDSASVGQLVWFNPWGWDQLPKAKDVELYEAPGWTY